MLPSWLANLSTSFSGDSAADLYAKDLNEELLLAREETIVAPLVHLSAIGFSGDDTTAFLQGQLSSDVKQVTLDRAQYSSYSTPKGRMLASFLLFQTAQGHVLLPSAEIKDAIQKRLSMFILRSKVKAMDPRLALLGLAGPKAEEILQALFGGVPEHDLFVMQHEQATIVRLPDAGYLLAVDADKVADVWQALISRAQPVGTAAWLLKEVNSGVLRVTGQTQELFVPQMANFDVIGAVSFTKGCYPGQEIVARTQYLGKLKRRTYLASVASPVPVEPGQTLYSSDLGEQATGHIGNSARSAEDVYDVLVVVHTNSIEHGVHLGALDGPELKFRQLPYMVQ